MVRVTPTIENFTIWRIFWVFEVPKKKFFLPFFKARKFILTSKLPFMILSSFLRFYWFLMNTFWKNDENPRTIFRAFSWFSQKVVVRNPCKSLWSILFIYFIDWTWFQLQKYKDKENYFFLLTDINRGGLTSKNPPNLMSLKYVIQEI